MIVSCFLIPLYNATVYYVDSDLGSDLNSGTSPGLAWQTLGKINGTTFLAGDSILFKAGGIWKGILWPKGSGSNEQQITISNYGEGEKPLIKGDGVVANVIYLKNQEYWTISNLEITNTKPGNDKLMLRGIYILAEDYGTVHNIRLENLSIHDVTGVLHAGDADDNLAKDNGGIFYEVKGYSVKTRFDGFYIIGCKIVDVDRTGISNKSTWKNRTPTENINWYPSLNIVIRNNWIERTGANGLIVRAAKAPLIEYNVFKQCGLKASGNAMFPFNCDDALFQFNEAFLTVYNPGDYDASGFDADYRCNRSVFQFNYSHDNDGGFMVVVSDGGATRFNDGTIVRYNISQNDGGDIFHIAGKTTNTLIYNNVIYSDTRKPDYIIKHKYWNSWPDSTVYINNIFCNLQGAPYTFGSSKRNIFDSNVFYGINPSSTPNDPNVINTDPRFMNPGSGVQGISTLDGYMLQSDSPCINNGLFLANHSRRDFWGNSVPYGEGLPDRGAFELQTNPLSIFADPVDSSPDFRILQNYPNPFNTATIIPYIIPESGYVNISIFNNAGQKVKAFDRYDESAGEHSVFWNGTDDFGDILSSGFYISKIKIGGEFKTMKLLLVK